MVRRGQERDALRGRTQRGEQHVRAGHVEACMFSPSATTITTAPARETHEFDDDAAETVTDKDERPTAVARAPQVGQGGQQA